MNKRNLKSDSPAGESSSSSMEQVRDLLFGAQLKDLETRIQRQEARFTREINDVKDALKKRLDSLENFMKSEASSLLARLKEEQQERDGAIKAEQRERQEALKGEQRERSESFKNEQRERNEAVAALNGELKNTAETFERKLTKVSATLDTVERELRQLLLSESGSLSDKIESRYKDALNVLAKTASQIRSDMVYRTALSGIFTEAVVELNNPWQNEDGSVSEEVQSLSVESEPQNQGDQA
jgi:DNA repair exonuclease SbcCD ATPase subunit